MQSKLCPSTHNLGSNILILQFITLLILKKITPLIPNSHKSIWTPVIGHSLSKSADFVSYVTRKGQFFLKKLFLTPFFI